MTRTMTVVYTESEEKTEELMSFLLHNNGFDWEAPEEVEEEDE